MQSIYDWNDLPHNISWFFSDILMDLIRNKYI